MNDNVNSLLNRLRGRVASWQAQCDRWEKSAADMGRPIPPGVMEKARDSDDAQAIALIERLVDESVTFEAEHEIQKDRADRFERWLRDEQAQAQALALALRRICVVPNDAGASAAQSMKLIALDAIEAYEKAQPANPPETTS